MDIQSLINKYENLSKALEGLGTEEIVNNFLADLRKLQTENGKLPIPRVIKSLPVSKEGLQEYMETTLDGRMLLLNITFPIANHFKTHPEYLKELAIEIVGNVL